MALENLSGRTDLTTTVNFKTACSGAREYNTFRKKKNSMKANLKVACSRAKVASLPKTMQFTREISSKERNMVMGH